MKTTLGVIARRAGMSEATLRDLLIECRGELMQLLKASEPKTGRTICAVPPGYPLKDREEN